MAIQKDAFQTDAKRYAGAIILVAVAFIGAYNFAAASSQANAANGSFGQPAGFAGVGGGGCGSGGGGGCCGGGGSSTPIEASTVVDGDVQRINVDTSNGSFNPNVIRATAGVPMEITFSQAPGGCMAGVFMPDFNVLEDLTGGAKTISIPALEAGEYPFYCQMQMISGTIIVE